VFANSNINIKNIAICMYGQYRTGDACLEYIKKFYQAKNVNIDFFCSLKPYETTYTRHAYNKKRGNPNILIPSHLNDDAIAYQTAQIQNTYKPKKFEVFESKYENMLMDINNSIVHSKVLSGWAETVMLKQQYEAENNISYDLVIMQRYDVIVFPSYAFESMIYKLQGLNTAERGTLASADKNIIFYQPIDLIRPYRGTLMFPNGQDLWVWGFGNALDIFVYDALEHIPSSISSNFTPERFNHSYPHFDTHEMVGSICRKMNIPYSMFPSVSPDGHVLLPLEKTKRPNTVYKGIAPIVMRDAYWDDRVIPDLVALGNDALEKLYHNVILPKWLKGE